MIPVTAQLSLNEEELEWDFIRASGPGGQNVNKVSSAVQLRFDVRRSASLPEEVKERLMHLAGRRITQAGVLVIDARRYRNQEANRQDALQRLIALIRKAGAQPKKRKATHPSAAARAARREEKRRRALIKRYRRPPTEWD
ncbi:MAG: aminoacyl-tRNA hydrolase [Ardenticatenia bacterium]|jgi:ribosome-associated protein|nr:MAG: aminoacyl-tRNA hydrolase [Ardenticatenia bacterium]